MGSKNIYKKSATILDVAAHSGISKSAVAYVLSDSSTGKVAPARRQRVLDAARELGYAPNPIARLLRTRKSASIGIMLPSPQNYFYAALALELQKCVWARGFTAFFAFWDVMADAEHIQKHHTKLRAWNVEGIITCELPGAIPSDNAIPLVLYHPWHKCRHDVVTVDYTALIDAMRHFRDRGHDRFALIAPPSVNARKAAFFNGLKSLGLAINPRWVFYGRDARAAGQNAMRQFLGLKKRPSMVVGCNDYMAISAMHAAAAQGVRAPRDMAFLGIDDVEEASFANPPLTTLRVPVGEVAAQLTELLFQRMENPAGKIIRRIIKPELIVRGST